MKTTKWEDFKYWLEHIIDWFPSTARSIKYGIQNLINWFPIIWKDRDWDHHFFHVMLRRKLTNMEQHLRKYGHHLNADKDADNIKVCVNLLNRIIDDEYCEGVYKNHDKKWGKSHFNWDDIPDDRGLVELHITRDNVITDEDKAQERKEFRRLIKHEGELKVQDKDYLYNTINKYILYWWD